MSTDTQEKWILYSTSDEDSNSELRALKVSPTDTVVSVTGSGCRTLSLLTQNPRTIISVDYSPGQSYLLQLKLAAIRALSYDRLLEFFGVDPCQSRWEMFQSLHAQIPPEAAAYFSGHRLAIEKGILFAGRHEQFYIRFVAPVMHLLFGRSLKRIYSCVTIEEQRKIYRDKLDGKVWRWLIRKSFSERNLRRVFNDQNYRFEMDVASSSEYMLERLGHTFSHHLAKDNHWMSFMLNGKYPSRSCLPHFLLQESCQAIRRATTEVKVVTDVLGSYLKGLPDESVDKFALSDVTSCIGRDEFTALLAEVARTGKPGGQVCYRNFLAKYPVSANATMRRDDSLCSSLDQADLAFVYSFEVATIAGHRDPAHAAVAPRPTMPSYSSVQ
jgi:S-adenosylmethionine-diacylglycerol 3-amino-3-carboxypropyl transferase